MIKVLLVDDEYEQRMYLRKIIDWEAHGYTIVGEAGNGVDALDLIHLKQPDVVFLDIDMPKMNGLTFLEHLHHEKCTFKTVIVSGHNKFDYACKAMSHGAKLYLLKPIDANELHDVLKEIMLIIEEENEQQSKIHDLHKKLDETLPLLKNKLLRQMVRGNVDYNCPSVYEQLSLLDIDPTSKHVLTAIIEQDDTFSISDESVLNTLQDTLYNPCLTYLKDYSYDMFQDAPHHVTLLVDLTPDNHGRFLKDLANMIECVHLKTGYTITIGCSQLYDIQRVHKAYDESNHILQAKTFLGSNTVLDYNDYQPAHHPYKALTQQYKERLAISLKCQDYDKLIAVIHDIYCDYATKQVTMDDLRMISSELITIGITHLSSMGYAASNVFGEHYHPLDLIIDYNSLDGIREHIIHFYEVLYNFIKDTTPPKLSDVVIQAKSYVQKHFSEPGLSLENIAADLYVHPVYLSSLFKKSMHKTMTQYVVDIRMKEAMELIRSIRTVSISEISSLTGYDNPYYFSKVFKKYYGASPTDILKKT